MAAQITIPVSNVLTLLETGFSVIEVQQSKDSGNSYHAVTASSPDSAFLDSALPNTLYRMGSKVLKFVLDGGQEQVVSFGSVLDFWTASQVAGRINEISPTTAFVVNGRVRLGSPTTGRGSSVVITYCDATDLGWFVGDLAHGHDQHLILIEGTLVYTYLDIAGAIGDLYRWRFSNDGIIPFTEYATRVEGTAPSSASPTSIATAFFVGLDGKPRQRSILIVGSALPQLISGFITGDEAPLIVKSDELGFLQVPLVRGSVVRVAIEGTALVREFTVPNVDTFDLMTALSTAPDPFTVQIPAPLLTRRNI